MRNFEETSKRPLANIISSNPGQETETKVVWHVSSLAHSVTSNYVPIYSFDCQIILIVYIGSLKASRLFVWYGRIPGMTDVTCEGSAQIAFKCSMIMVQCYIDCIMLSSA